MPSNSEFECKICGKICPYRTSKWAWSGIYRCLECGIEFANVPANCAGHHLPAIRKDIAKVGRGEYEI